MAVAEDAEASVVQRGEQTSLDHDANTSSEILAAATVLLEHLAVAQPNEQGRVVVSGPTWILGPAIRGATVEAPEQLVSALQAFIREQGWTPEHLREAVSSASAWSETLIGYDHVQNGDAAAWSSFAGARRVRARRRGEETSALQEGTREGASSEG